MSREVTGRHWFGKVSAGLFCGFLLGLGASGLFNLAVPAGQALFEPENIVSTLPFNVIWVLTVSFCFLFGSTRRAWVWLSSATVILWGLLHLLGATA
jgi:hypothetical protein